MDKESLEVLVCLLGVLRAMKWNYWNSHWMVKGNPYYGDHLLFERLYGEDIDQQIDTLAEKIVAYDASILSGPLMRSAFAKFLDRHESNTDSFSRALNIENSFQDVIKKTYREVKSSGGLSLGMDDFLMSTANERETSLYLITQRTRGR